MRHARRTRSLPYPADAHGWQGCSGPLDGGGGDGRADCSLIGRPRCASPSSPPGFPGMTFSLGNHFLRASTAIFNFNSFMKSCLAHVNTRRPTRLRTKLHRRRRLHVVVFLLPRPPPPPQRGSSKTEPSRAEPSSTAAGCPSAEIK